MRQLDFSFYSLGLSVGIAVTLMIYLKVMHPPAASNPLVVLFTDVSFEFIFIPSDIWGYSNNYNVSFY